MTMLSCACHPCSVQACAPELSKRISLAHVLGIYVLASHVAVTHRQWSCQPACVLCAWPHACTIAVATRQSMLACFTLKGCRARPCRCQNWNCSCHALASACLFKLVRQQQSQVCTGQQWSALYRSSYTCLLGSTSICLWTKEYH